MRMQVPQSGAGTPAEAAADAGFPLQASADCSSTSSPEEGDLSTSDLHGENDVVVLPAASVT
eukprot:CAMPEP_0171096326 /NCGR_PEP_ID=MMETSP0766_2-20121228/44339_1 /TAXON_ID=439317 /ORGANISM="Gambierdiscus australes, Strain CAWD 149" /LENGTH=61 /DNA_ID=CAMNT_0011555285 /DNA_START=183 /DNA_END=366 /DNA_ORIENTATION=+